MTPKVRSFRVTGGTKFSRRKAQRAEVGRSNLNKTSLGEKVLGFLSVTGGEAPLGFGETGRFGITCVVLVSPDALK